MATNDTLFLIIAVILGILLLQFVISCRRSAIALRSKKDLHIRRKIQHALSGISIYVASYWIHPQPYGAFILYGCAGSFYFLHYLRMRNASVNRVFLQAFGPILRAHEIHQLPGAFYFLVGSAVCFHLFPSCIARLSILQLSIADPIASLIGTLYGDSRPKWTGKLFSSKSYAGIAACACTCSLIAAWSVFDIRQTFASMHSTTFVLFSGIVGALAEAINIGVDDNLSMPILASIMMHFILKPTQ